MEPVQAHRFGRAWRRAAALILILALLLSPSAAGPQPAHAAPAAQAQNLCTMVPPGWDAGYATDMADYCFVGYNDPYGEPDVPVLFLELSRAYSPDVTHDLMVSCHPSDCAAGNQCYGRPCQAIAQGDVAPAGVDKGFQGVFYMPYSSGGGYAYAWTRGCYLLVGSVGSSKPEDNDRLWALMLKADALINTGSCAGCSDPAVCQATGAGSTSSVCGPGVEAPAGTLAVSTTCEYQEAIDGVKCQAAVVNACPNANFSFTWRLDGGVASENGTELFNPSNLRLCAGTHTVSVTVEDKQNNLTATSASSTYTVTKGSPCAGATGGSIQIQAPSGTTNIGGDDPLSTTSLVLNANEQLTQLLADCPELGLALLLGIGFDEQLARADPGPTEAGVILTALVIDCVRLHSKAEGPLQIASVGDPALFLPAQAATEDLPVRLWIGLQGGPLRVSASSDQVLVDVQTSAASVRSAGKNDFGFNLDAQTGEMTVAVYGGSVEVYSNSTGSRLASLAAGQQVQVSPDGASLAGSIEEGTGPSVVGPYGEGNAPTEGAGAAAPRRSSGTAALIGIPLAILLLGAAVVLVRSRGKKPARAPVTAAPVAPAARTPVQVPRPTTPRQVTIVPSAGPRLVVVAGTARPQAIELSGGPVTIGRDPSCALVVDDLLVAGQHAQVSLQDRFWVLQDLGSSSGTFLAGVRIQRQALRPGDRIQVGRTVIQFQVGG